MAVTIATGTATAASTDICSRAQVKTHLGITDTTDDTVIDAIIDRVTDAFETHWRVPTVPVTTATRTVMVSGPTIYADELITVTSITDACGNTLSYETVGGLRSTDPLRWVTITTWPFAWRILPIEGPVSIAGTWGYATMPADVVHAAVLTCAVWYKRMKGGGEVDNSFIGNLDAIPKEARQIMDARKHRRG